MTTAAKSPRSIVAKKVTGRAVAKSAGGKKVVAKKAPRKTVSAATKPAARKRVDRVTPATTANAASLAKSAIFGTTGIIRTLAGISTSAVAKATGHGWTYWLKALDKAGAAALPHREIVALLSKSLGLKHPWWVQMITVAYEQARGIRKPNQRSSGFAATVTRTIAVPINALYAAWEEGRRGDWLPDAIEVRRANKNKSMKVTWPDGSGIDVHFYDKGGNKTVVEVEQTKLPDAGAVAAVKDVWSAALDRLKTTLEGKR